MFVTEYNESIGWLLVFEHRPRVLRDLADYDLFMYFEDDSFVLAAQVVEWMHESRRLLLDGLFEYEIGLWRFDIAERNNIERVTLPSGGCLMQLSNHRWFVESAIYQPLWMAFTQKLLPLQETHPFFFDSGDKFTKGWLFGEHASFDLFGRVGFKRVFPVETWAFLGVQHLGQSTQAWRNANPSDSVSEYDHLHRKGTLIQLNLAPTNCSKAIANEQAKLFPPLTRVTGD